MAKEPLDRFSSAARARGQARGARARRDGDDRDALHAARASAASPLPSRSRSSATVGALGLGSFLVERALARSRHAAGRRVDARGGAARAGRVDRDAHLRVGPARRRGSSPAQAAGSSASRPSGARSRARAAPVAIELARAGYAPVRLEVSPATPRTVSATLGRSSARRPRPRAEARADAAATSAARKPSIRFTVEAIVEVMNVGALGRRLGFAIVLGVFALVLASAAGTARAARGLVREREAGADAVRASREELRPGQVPRGARRLPGGLRGQAPARLPLQHRAVLPEHEQLRAGAVLLPALPLARSARPEPPARRGAHRRDVEAAGRPGRGRGGDHAPCRRAEPADATAPATQRSPPPRSCRRRRCCRAPRRATRGRPPRRSSWRRRRRPQTRRPVWKRWWFWTGVGAVVAGGVVAAFFLTRPQTSRPARSTRSTAASDGVSGV